MTRTAEIVIGAGYGDEGKGLATDFLVREDSLVVRFNSGPQAGHTVTRPDGRSHVFSHLGSGTLRGVPTFWSKFCAVSPNGFVKELEVLNNKFPDLKPYFMVSPHCPVITPWDMAWNQYLENKRGFGRHGSCGIGFGATIGRHEETPYKIYADDLHNPVVLEDKFWAIFRYYSQLVQSFPDHEWQWYGNFYHPTKWTKSWKTFEAVAKEFASLTRIATSDVLRHYEHLVFEGAQGVLLDQDHGVFPHVTRSNTTSKNALALIQENIPDANININYMTRSYGTRHGAGPMPNEQKDWRPTHPYPRETNKTNPWQGELRYGPLNEDMIKYAVRTDQSYHSHDLNITSNMFITCCDQEPAPKLKWPVPVRAKSFGPCRENVKAL